MKKRKILVWADSPTVATGFAQVSRNVLKELYKTGRYEIDMIGINYNGEYDREKFDKEYYFLNKIIPAQQLGNPDLYGRENIIAVLTGHSKYLTGPYDIFFSIQDHFIIQQKDSAQSKGLGQAIKHMQANTLQSEEFRDNHFLWVGYFPVDGMLKESWVSEAIAPCDYPVAYCAYGAGEMLKASGDLRQSLEKRLNIIYHGTNIDDFYPLSSENRVENRKKYFNADEKTHIIMNVARNQPRKDLFKTLVVYKEWLKYYDNSLLYMHCNPFDMAGGNLYDMAKFLELPLSKIAFPKGFGSNTGVTLKHLNMFYNCADAFLTTTLGEGWGLPITEAMACKVPVYAPNITSITDILNTHNGFNPEISRGMSFKAGSSPTEWTNAGNLDNEVPRPITNVEDAVNMLKWGFENKERVAKIVDRAYEWTQNHTWEKENEQWVQIFDEACQINDRLRSGVIGTGKKKLGRNENCPICLDKKIKNCKLHRDIYL